METWQARAENRPTLCFAVDRAHAKHLQLQFQAAGVSAEYIDAYVPAFERAKIGQRLHDGEVKVVCNVGCLTTGVDWDIRCVILARPTKSEILYVQMIGRGLRTAQGKADCLILDHSDNHARLGFVTDIHHDKLDTGEPKRAAKAKNAEALPKKCPACSFLRPPKVRECPACGFIATQQPAVHREGELIELALRRAARAEQTDKQKFYCELRAVAQERGYKQGWAAVKYKEKFGAYPPWAWNDTPTLEPSMSTVSWVKSRHIAFSKRSAAS